MYKRQGMDRYEARKAIVADLEAGGYLASIEPHKHNAVSYTHLTGASATCRAACSWK